jgi:hypothetical protein
MDHPMEAAFVAQAARTVFSLAMEVGKGIGGWKKKANDIERAALKYCQNYVENHGRIQVLGMPEPAPLYELYIAVRMASPQDLTKFGDEASLEAAVRADGNRLSRESSYKAVRDGIVAANEIQRLNVLGPVGASKSTYLRRLGLEALLPYNSLERILGKTLGAIGRLRQPGKHGAYIHGCLPILVELKDFRIKTLNLETEICHQLADGGFPDAPDFTRQLLKSGRLLLLLDGLDEAPPDKLDIAIDEVRDFVGRHENNRYVIASRRASRNNHFPKFHDMALTGFSDAQIQQFIQRWFGSGLGRGQQAEQGHWDLLKQPAYSGALELARTPLLLTYICLAYGKNQSLLANPSQLYEEVLDVLMQKWSVEKGMGENEIYKGLSQKLERSMLAQIAANAFAEQKFIFNESFLVEEIEKYLLARLAPSVEIDGRKILAEIEAKQGLFIQQEPGLFSFSHLTVQELLAAQYFRDSSQYAKLSDNHLVESHWREVFLLVADLSSALDGLLNTMIDATHRLLAPSKKISDLARLVSQWCSGASQQGQEVELRGIAWLLIVSTALAWNRSRKYESGSEERWHELLKACKHSINMARYFNSAPELESLTPTKEKGIYGCQQAIEYFFGLLSFAASVGLIKSATSDFQKEMSSLSNSLAEYNLESTETTAYNRFTGVISRELDASLVLFDWSAQDTRACLDYLYAAHLIISCKEASANDLTHKEWRELINRLFAPAF